MTEQQDNAKEALAEIFIEQCIGEHAGHMASLPNNPEMQLLFMALEPKCRTRGKEGRAAFQRTLHKLADYLATEK